MLPLPLIANGKGFIRALENDGALAVYAPLEGGYEGRYQRRLRANGYTSVSLSARGLGDVEAYLMQVHGVRPAHLGKKNIAQEGAVGPVYFAQPIAGYQLENLPAQSKGLVLWILEGYILSQTEIQDLISLTKREPKLKVVLEMGGDRVFRWQPLLDCLQAA
ncbi:MULTISPECIES: NAD(P)H-quinone oxidoreductase subunit N [Synechocystis]|uniref:NAD(P)H-quinone oxidoreductase subunit N n=1 Tax=Synechocystis salina LEGE 00031 TaxID=1828736 RepID=A0ABR9VQQ1_9SYNC|nr:MULTISPECIES: NAD(P)H-quinone oxidoreductase subunit N [Synechocystis]MBD2653183.1 NAD(P)H-quinone oxidoreductase subunit N [Synechocystis sp. FACHB-383]MBE9197271.1 NAD(P)H-quinone oxidoreductase subunit N [Synechocystis sp. LEGE 06083]MBE9241162.1 NAD(P)H-quinone oxidoreductase subunit N [Synechocystis salina LEGE 00041]MBE9252818.1 NAD(P)H-quinone oxidoreductase subunit N [Synechocystis salina LEGE 00031]